MAQNSANEIVGTINHMKRKGSFKTVVAGLLIGVALLVVGSFALNGSEEEKKSETQVDISKYESFIKYKENMEKEIEYICLGVSGVKSVRIITFFDSVGESLYAQNTQVGNTEKTEYVIIGSGSYSHALYIGESLPSLSGIGIVCDSGGSEGVRNTLAALVSATYGLPLTRVYVSEGG